jgi:DNA-directed RNA polymerase specialized sigma24 family protein
VVAGIFDLHRIAISWRRLVVDPIVQLGSTWRQGAAGARLNTRLRAWSADEPSLVRFTGSAERLFRFLRSEPSAERDRVFCALLRQARRDELAALVLLEALLPGLKSLLGRILVDTRESDELLAVLLKNTWEQIATYPLERRPQRVAANLLLDIRKKTLQELGHQRRTASEQPLTRREAAATIGADIEAPLRRAVGVGALSDTEAELILQSRVDRRPLAEIAAELGLAYVTVYKRRAKAERRLLLFLGQPSGKNRGGNRHMSSARTVRLSGAGSASGGAVTDNTPKEVTDPPRRAAPSEQHTPDLEARHDDAEKTHPHSDNAHCCGAGRQPSRLRGG